MSTEERTIQKTEVSVIIEAYAAQGMEACTGKGGFHVRDRGFVTLRQARKETGIDQAKKRQARQVQGAWGEWGWVAAANGAL